MTPQFVRAFVLLALAAFFLSACRVVVETKINANGSGELQNSVVFSAEETANFVAASENAGKHICDNLNQSEQAGAEFREEMRNGETYCTTLHSFTNLNELRGYYDRLGNVTVHELNKGLNSLIFDVQVDLTPRNGNEAAATEWRLTLPGKLGNNNAEAMDGQTLIWKLDPGEVATLHAESSIPIDPWIWVSISLVLLLLGMASIILIRKR